MKQVFVFIANLLFVYVFYLWPQSFQLCMRFQSYTGQVYSLQFDLIVFLLLDCIGFRFYLCLLV
jgi:hypothetical protein